MLSYIKRLEAQLPKQPRLLPSSLSGYGCDLSQLQTALHNWWAGKPSTQRKAMYSMNELVREIGWPRENIGRGLRAAGRYQRRIYQVGSTSTVRRWYPPLNHM